MKAQEYLKQELSKRELWNTETDDCYQVLAEIMQEYARLAIKETIETAKHHIDGDFDAEGTEVNTLRILGL